MDAGWQAWQAAGKPQTREDARGHLAKLVGMLGSHHAGEQANALKATDQALTRCGLTWVWIGDLVARGEVPGGDREKFLARLVADRLRVGLQYAWSMTGEESTWLRDLMKRASSGLAEVSVRALERAVGIADGARRRAQP